VPVLLPPSQLNRIFRFGDFEFSVRAGELRKNSEIVRLQHQPLRVLLALLEYSGEVITRDEIRDRVWPDDSVQDFDNSLRVAVAKLRQALADDPDDPLYIETLPRRGYRWLYPVTVEDSPPSAFESEVQRPEGIDMDRMQPVAVLGDSPTKRRQGVGVKSAFLTLFLVLAAFAASKFLRAAPEMPEPKVVPLTTYPGLELMPSISPDGKRVAFAWTGPEATGSYGVYVKGVGDDRARRLTETPVDAADGDPVWTPDGRSVLFFRRSGPGSGIYSAPVDGGAAHELVAVDLRGRRIRRSRFDISPRGNAIVYPDPVPGQETVALFLFDLGTLLSRQLTHPPPNSEGDGDPVFSHDGNTIAFQRDTLDQQQLYVLPAGGDPERMLTSKVYGDFIDGLAWTADDREILIGGSRLWRIPVSGGADSIKSIPYIPGPATFPVVRNTRLAYVLATENANIWKLDLRDPTHAAGEPSRLISSTRQQAAMAYSPNGSRIAFQSDRSGNWEIWICDRDGSNAVQLTHFASGLTGTPRWSPDGKQIAFDSHASGVSQIYVVSADGGNPRQVTYEITGSRVPSWSHDGKWIYYSTISGKTANIFRLPAAGGTPQSIASHGGIYAVESADGKYLYYSRGPADPTIWRVPIGGGPEEQMSGVPRPFDTSHWVVVASGIYIVDGNGDLQFYRFDNGSVARVLHDQKFLTDWSMAVSPDGREIAWAQVDTRLADLMLVENFR
jgi:Tol biopolymer transport system component/DNA-binding winged helix-turn-helix (wHTH) protein